MVRRLAKGTHLQFMEMLLNRRFGFSNGEPRSAKSPIGSRAYITLIANSGGAAHDKRGARSRKSCRPRECHSRIQ